MQGSQSARVCVRERVSLQRACDQARGVYDHALSGVFLYKKRYPPTCGAYFYLLLSVLTPLLLIFAVFCFFAVSILYFSIFFCYSTVMDFPPILEDLGDDLGAGGGSFSLDDLDLDDVSFRHAAVGTYSAAGPSGTTGVSGGSSSHPRPLRGDPISVTYSLETHAWTMFSSG